jgi:toxin ParE1/3/4
MTKTDVEFHPEAREEYLQALQWYLERSERIARRLQQELIQAVDLIAEEAEQWPRFEGEIRFLRLRRFPFVLYFEPAREDQLFILAVAHQSRRPGYWRYRREE